VTRRVQLLIAAHQTQSLSAQGADDNTMASSFIAAISTSCPFATSSELPLGYATQKFHTATVALTAV